MKLIDEQAKECLDITTTSGDFANITTRTSLVPRDLIQIKASGITEVLRIDLDGRIFWKELEVETDDDFRAAMLELKDALTGLNK